MFKWLRNFINKITNKRLRKSLKKKLRENEIVMDSDIDSIQTLWENSQKRKNFKYDEFFNICLYSSLVGRDISILWNEYSLTNNQNKKNLYGRLLSMTIIEFLDDINGLLGKNFRLELEKNRMFEFIDELREINKEFSQIKKLNNKELRKIRNNSAAHKTKKAKDLMDFTKKKHFENLHDISAELTTTNVKLTRLTTEIIYKMTAEMRVKLEELKLKKLEQNDA